MLNGQASMHVQGNRPKSLTFAFLSGESRPRRRHVRDEQVQVFADYGRGDRNNNRTKHAAASFVFSYSIIGKTADYW